MNQEISDEELEQLDKETELDNEWITEHSIELSKEHPGEYVAVIDQKAVAFGKSDSEAHNRAKRKFPDRSPLVGYIPKEGDELLLV